VLNRRIRLYDLSRIEVMTNTIKNQTQIFETKLFWKKNLIKLDWKLVWFNLKIMSQWNSLSQLGYRIKRESALVIN